MRRPVALMIAVGGLAWTQGACGRAPAAADGASPAPDRPVATVVSSTWGEAVVRDKAGEVDQIATRLGVRPGMTVADIGSGDGYDTLRLASRVGPRGKVIAEDITSDYLDALARKVAAAHAGNVTLVLGAPDDPKIADASLDAAIMVHMYHEIASPYALLYRLALSFRPGGRLGIEELDRVTNRHGTPPELLKCELAAVGYRLVSLEPMTGDIGYFAVFAAPDRKALPRPADIKPCKASAA